MASVLFYYLALKKAEASRAIAMMGGLSPLATALISIPLLAPPLGGTSLTGRTKRDRAIDHPANEYALFQPASKEFPAFIIGKCVGQFGAGPHQNAGDRVFRHTWRALAGISLA